MNRNQDTDQLLRSWLDEGPEVMPERYMWAALERIETTRQRGAFLAPLEDLFMRIQPIAAVIGVAAVLVAGIGIYLAVSGGPRVGDPDETDAPESSYISSEFAIPVSFNVPDGWVTYEAREGVVTGAPTVGGVTVGERVVIFRTSSAEIFSGTTDGLVPWPDDLAAWLADNPVPSEPEGPGSLDLEVLGQSDQTVGASEASVIEASSSYTAPEGLDQSVDFIVVGSEADGTDTVVRPGEMSWRFVVIPDREVGIAYGAAPDELSEERFGVLLDSLTFREP